ncbi:hypothetical protein ACFL0W_00570 [Nanoarchaeota archaeon]
MVFVYPAYHTKIKYRGSFHLLHFYRMLKENFRDKEYIATQHPGVEAFTDEKYMETYYSQRLSSDPHLGKIVWIWWRTKKTDQNNKYYHFRLNLTFHLRFLRDIEVMHEGHKVKTQDGEIEMFVDSDLVCDAEGKWEENWFLKHIHKLFYERIWRLERDNKRQLCRDDAEFFTSVIKKYFGLPIYDTPYASREKDSFYYTGDRARPYEPAE